LVPLLLLLLLLAGVEAVKERARVDKDKSCQPLVSELPRCSVSLFSCCCCCCCCCSQEFEAAAQRAKVDKEKAKLSADVDRLRQQLLGLSDQAAARQAAVSLELQHAKLQKELDLQVRVCSCNLAMNLYLSACVLQAEGRTCRSRCAGEARLLLLCMIAAA
jgi:hypothetical protein